MGREATYLQFTPTARARLFSIPPVGTILLLLTYLGFVLALEFINNSLPLYGAQYWQALGVRAAWLAVSQVPLLILLVGKNNLIGLATEVSYERLNVLHRWVARMLLLLATFHFGFQSYGWSKYGVMKLEWATDTCPPTGIAAYAVLLWMNLSTFRPIRHFSYEFFVVQHIITFFGFIIAVMWHLPSTAYYSRVYIYIPIALYLLDRIVRTAWYAYVNIRISRATLTALDGGVTRIRLSNPAIKHWRAGSHMLISFPRFGFGQSHPATIASTPSSHNGDLVFMLKSHKGFTKRIMKRANNSAIALLPHTKQESKAGNNAQVASYHVLLDGPYGGSQSDFAAFDSACLFAGSTGITFVMSIMQDIADRASSGKALPLRRLQLVWCVKESSWARWASEELDAAVSKLEAAGIQTDVHIYVTCADGFTDQETGAKECGCTCDKSQGPCCCVVVDEDDEGQVDSDEVSSARKRTTAVAKEKSTTSSASSLEAGAQRATRMPILPCAAFYSGRPDISEILSALLDHADGESGVAVCGPVDLTKTVRNTAVRLSDHRAIHKGTNAQGLYVHVEGFGV